MNKPSSDTHFGARDKHQSFLLAALEQAFKGRGFCAPNPGVGAVAVQNDTIIAQAWHHGAGSPHAEQNLLMQLSKGLSGVTLYVTLEPCNHWGKTPPCVEAIIEYGVKRVVYAYRDPNPMVAANNTPEILKKHGIAVVFHPLNEINEFYESYTYWTHHKKPYVTLKMAQSLDGKIAGSRGERIRISNDLCAELTHKSRLYTDVIITTFQTIQKDNPRLNARLLQKNIAKPVAIIDRKCELEPHASVLQFAKHCMIYHSERYKPREKLGNCIYYAIPEYDGKLDLQALLSHLGRLGYHDAWVEAGARLSTALHQKKLVQKTLLYIAPVYLGCDATPSYVSSLPLPCQGMIEWQPKADNMVLTVRWYNPEDENRLCSQA